MDNSKGKERFLFIDALRGVAAIAVVMHHAFIKSAMAGPLHRTFPLWLGYALTWFAPRGVQIFFVISGFVIAHSLRRTPMNARECGRFIVRRQLRLDPPYWVMLIIAVLMTSARRFLPAIKAVPFPGWGALAANLIYVEKILGLPDVLDVGWTLAIEIQFYLAFMLILAIARRPGPSRTAMALLLITALAATLTDPDITFTARWAVHAWPYFAAGVFCYWAVQGGASPWFMVGVLVAMLGAAIGFGIQSPVIVGIATTLAIYWAGQSGAIYTLWRNEPLQFLGRISYSLYLTHMLVVVVFQQAAYKLTHDSRAAAVFWFFASIGVAVGVAYPFHRFIELPSMRLASRFKRDAGPSAATGFGEELPAVEDVGGAGAASG